MALPQHLEIVLRTIPIELRLCLSDSANPEIAWKLQLSCGHELGFLDAFAFWGASAKKMLGSSSTASNDQRSLRQRPNHSQACCIIFTVQLLSIQLVARLHGVSLEGQPASGILHVKVQLYPQHTHNYTTRPSILISLISENHMQRLLGVLVLSKTQRVVRTWRSLLAIALALVISSPSHQAKWLWMDLRPLKF